MLTIGLIKNDMTEKSGGDRVAAMLSAELAKYYRVHLISINGKGEAPFYDVDEAVVYAPLLHGHGRMRSTIFPGGKAIRRYVKENGIDVLLSIGGNVNPFLFLATVGTKTKAVFCEHLNLIMANKDRSNHVVRDLGVSFAHKIVTLTQRDKEAYISHYKLAEERVEYIYNWMDDGLRRTAVKYAADSKRIITVGSLGPQKGYDLLVPAAKLVFEKHPDWQWDIYGDGAQWDQIQAAIRDNGLEENLHLMGATDSVYDLYKDYALYVMTSRFEGLPMVLLEAKANGLPIVSFDCLTGPAEIVKNGVNGYLVPPENVEMLAGRICQLMEDRELREQFSAHAGENMELFDKARIVEQWKTLIDSLLERK